MNTPKEARESKQRLVSAGRDMQLLLVNESFQTILEAVDEKIRQTREEALASKSFEDLVAKREFMAGLAFLKQTCSTTIGKGKGAEKTLNK